jgi:hypothetical protein
VKPLGRKRAFADGWYGRPYDNQDTLTAIEQCSDKLTIVLDQKLTLRFDALKSIVAEKGKLTLTSCAFTGKALEQV